MIFPIFSHIFTRSKTKDEYLEFAARLILYLREESSKARKAVEAREAQLENNATFQRQPPEEEVAVKRIKLSRIRKRSLSDGAARGDPKATAALFSLS